MKGLKKAPKIPENTFSDALLKPFFFCDAAAQLAVQFHQERTQVVCGSKEVRKRLTQIKPYLLSDKALAM